MKYSRKAAIQAGERTYRTGKACKHGHLSMRYTLNACCAMCQRLHAHARQEKDRANFLAAQAKNKEAAHG